MQVSRKPLTVRDLPTELFRNILDHLGCESEDTLAACTLVCRDWLDVSRQHLFNEIHVLRGADESFEDFADFLESHPVHAAYIHTLQLEARLFSIPYNVALMPTISIDLFMRIARALPGLQTVRLRQVHVKHSGPSVPVVAPEQRQPLEHMEYEKCYSEVEVAFTLLSLFRINHLDLSPFFPEDGCSDIRPGDHKIQARSLCVTPDTPQPMTVFKALHQVVPPSMIISFRWPIYTLSDPQLPVVKFLQHVGQNLVDVNLGPSERDNHLALHYLPRLQTFRYCPGVALLAPPDVIHKQRALFATFPADYLPLLPEDLHELILYVQWGADEDAACLLPNEDSLVMWGADSAMMKRLRRLKKLTLCVPSLPGDEAEALAVAGVCFPRAHALGVLRIDVVVWELECREYDIYHYLRDC